MIFVVHQSSALLTLQHVVVGVVSHGEQMGRHLVPSLALELRDDALGVDREPLVRVDRHTEQAGVGLCDTKRRISTPECVLGDSSFANKLAPI